MRKKSGSKQIHLQRQRHRKFKISDLRFQMEETASSNATGKTNANADPSPLKGVRDDSLALFSAACKAVLNFAGLSARLPFDFAQGEKSCPDKTGSPVASAKGVGRI
jgi:hypothetical protein